MEKYFDENVKAMVEKWAKDTKQIEVKDKIMAVIERIRYGVIDKYGILIIPNPAKCTAMNRVVEENGNLTNLIVASLEIDGFAFGINFPYTEGVEEMMAINVE